MRFALGMAVGFALGLAAFWIYSNREALGFAVAHRDSIAAGGNLINDAKTFWGTL